MIPTEVIGKLLEAGYHPTTIALTLDIPIEECLEVAQGRREHVAVDDELRQGIRVLAFRTLEEAMRILDEGTPQMKMQLISKFGGDMARVLGKDDPNKLKNLRNDFYELMKEVRGAGTDDSASDHQDEGLDAGEVSA